MISWEKSKGEKEVVVYIYFEIRKLDSILIMNLGIYL